jgi:hypothetical protein
MGEDISGILFGAMRDLADDSLRKYFLNKESIFVNIAVALTTLTHSFVQGAIMSLGESISS